MATTLEDRELAREALTALEQRPARLTLPDGSSVELPSSAVDGLLDLLAGTADGDEVVVVRSARELTTQQAASVLNVSRPTVVKLIDDGVLPSRMVGSHRRVALADVLAYRDDIAARRREALDEMVAEAEVFGLYD